MKKNIIFALLALFLTPWTGQAQNWKWAKSLSTPNNATAINNLNAYPGKHALVSGSFAAPTLTFGTQTLTNAGQDDGFAALADEMGQYIWAAKFGGSNRDFVVDAAAAPNGDFAVVGNFTSISLPIGSANLINSGETDAFIAKYKADKTLAWAKKIGTPDIDEASSVALDADGNTYVLGHVLNKLTLATEHVFLRKYDASGNLVWEKKGTNPNGALKSTVMTLDANQQVYVSGCFWGTVSFDNTSMTNDTAFAAYIVKYSPSGTVLDTYLNGNLSRINDIQTQSSTLHFCAERGSGCFGWGWPLARSEVQLVKLDSDLNQIWHKTAGGVEDCQSFDIAKSLSLDDHGNAYLTGYFFSDTLSFAGQALPNFFNIHYFYPQIFVMKYSPSGEELWGKSLGGIHSDEGTGILAIGDDQFYLGGDFESAAVNFGSVDLQNTGTLDSMYVHLRPSRFVRQTMGFLAVFDGDISSVHPEPAFDGMVIFPNPVTDHITLRLKSPAQSPLHLQISTADGRVLRQSKHSGQSLYLQEDLTGLPSGLYIVSVRSENGLFSTKFVK